MKAKILITGGTGYIGSHTAVELQNAGFDVFIIDNLSNSNIEVLERIKKITGVKPNFEKLDLAERDVVDDFFKRHKDIESVIHFAALKAVGESVEKPLLYYKNNISGLINLLQPLLGADQVTRSTQKKHCLNFIFSSSCTVYGEPDTIPVTEASPIKKAVSPYGNTKQMAEYIIADAVKANSGRARAVFLRYFNPIGAHKSGLIGELPNGEPTNLAPYITQTAIGIRKCVKVFGDDYPTPDGSGIRDYIHVVDLAKAHVAAVKRLLENKNKSDVEIFNLGTGKGSSVFEIIKTFEQVANLKLNYKIAPRREGDIAKIWADTSLANRELGWAAGQTLEDALRDGWNWEKKYRENKF